jgi:hypothetical protein
MTSSNRGFIFDNETKLRFINRFVTVDQKSNNIKGSVITGKSEMEIAQAINLHFFKGDKLPKWLKYGPIVGIEGGSQHVIE